MFSTNFKEICCNFTEDIFFEKLTVAVKMGDML